MNKRIILLLVTALWAGGLLSACRAGQPPAPAQPTAQADPLLALQPEPGSAGNPLVQMLPPAGQTGEGQAAMAMLDQQLAERGLHAISSRAGNAARAIRAVCNGSADVAWLAAVSYLAASELCPDLQWVALLQASQPLRGQLLVLNASSIAGLSDLNGQRVALGAPNSIAGHLYPAALLRDEGVEASEIFFAGSDELALQALLAGEAEAAVISSAARPALSAAYPQLAADIKILAETAEAPGDVIVAAAGIPPAVISGYRSALQAIIREDSGRAMLADLGPWAAVEDGDPALLADLRQAIAKLAIEPANWKGVSSPYRVGLVTRPGNVDDGGLNAMAHAGLAQAAEQYGVVYAFIETAQLADHLVNVEQFARQGFDLVVTVDDTFDQSGEGISPIASSVLAMAQKYPGVHFVILNFAGGELPENVSGVAFAEDQAGFLAGVLAGLMSQSKTVGFIGGVESPPIRRYRNGFEHGARYVCGDCTVIGVTIDSFSDPVRGRTAALSQIGEGVDVIFSVGGLTAAGALTSAAEDGVYVIGAEEDHYLTTFENGAREGADRLLSSASKRADVASFSLVAALLREKLPAGILFLDAAGGGVGLAPFHEAEGVIPSGVRMALEDILVKLASGELATGVDVASGAAIEGQIPAPGSFSP